jgi:hypothetical protein
MGDFEFCEKRYFIVIITKLFAKMKSTRQIFLYKALVFVLLSITGFAAIAEHQVVTKTGDLTHIVHYDRFETLDDAKAACYEFVTSLGVSNPYCATGSNSLVTAGNYREEGTLVWHYLRYYYKQYLLAPDFDSCPKEGNPCSVVTGAKLKMRLTMFL